MQKKTNANEKKAENGFFLFSRGGWMRMTEHFFFGKRERLFFSLGKNEGRKNASTLCVINPSLYIA
jgi:hypothetical protein